MRFSVARYCRLSKASVIRSLLVVLLFGGVVGCGPSGEKVNPPRSNRTQVDATKTNPLVIAQRAIARRDWPAAEAALQAQLVQDPDDVAALEMAGDVAAARGQIWESARLYQAAVDKNENVSIELFDKLAQQWTAAGSLFESLTVLQQAIEKYPSYPPFRFDLAGLGTLIGMERISVEQMQWLTQHKNGDAENLIGLAASGRILPDESICETALQRCPDDVRIQYPLARLEAAERQWSKVADRLESVVRQRGDFIPAQLLYGRALVELGRTEDVQRWHADLPSGVEDNPSYWAIGGKWAERQGEYEQAARAFGEAVRLDRSNDPVSLKNLMLNLTRMRNGDIPDRLVQRVQQFAELNDTLDKFDWRDCQSQSTAFAVARHMESMGRLWEAEGWARIALSMKDDQISNARESYLAIRKNLRADSPWQSADGLIGDQLNLEDLPLVAWSANPKEISGNTPVRNQDDIRMEDEAFGRGLIHTCELSPQTNETGYAIYHTSGGGGAIIDFDFDGWPDIAVAMLDGEPMKTNSQPNQLYRNLAGQFQNVTALAGMADTGFGQGISVGDFNDDGFPDVFDANIGRNRMYRNNGDGTFSDVTEEVGLSGEFWTTSATIADIDGDGLSDLFEVEYCAGETPYTKKCTSTVDESRIGSCSPLLFSAQPDHVWRGGSEGKFTEVTDRWLSQTNPGRGLGVTVGHFDEREGIDMYIANDMSANQFWSSTVIDDQFHLGDLAVLRGLAVSGESKSQASMGIAAGDPDEDGDIDFLLTHFARDHNTYYQQNGPGIWSDRSYQLGLGDSSMNQMGFGTEWVDFDNNGRVELIISNGHVNAVADDDPYGITFAMPAQVYQCDRSGVWQELENDQMGDYFKNRHVGRALATLDANRDGLVDVFVTHLFEPVSLLINQTETRSSSQGFVLKAIEGQRDAIGATVTSEVGGRTRSSQLLAGDGYMCTNQRRISIGMGAATVCGDVRVRWPSGNDESFGDIVAGEDVLLVEGTGSPFRLP
jgi:tetratricopeptide (TPR) repeat protein